MSAEIRSIEDHVRGEYSVNVNFGGNVFRKFESMVDASKWLELMKASSRDEVESIFITLKEIVITAKQQFNYETCYVV